MDKLTVNVGGDRLGSGNKMNVDLRTYNRSTHDLSYVWRNTQAPGTLVPFMVQLGLPGDTFDIELNADVLTHPTTGPLFGSFKLQLDVFQCPIRLYNSWLHNNRLGIGLDMSQVKLPKIQMGLPALKMEDLDTMPADEQQINKSSLLSYLGINGGYRKSTLGSDYMYNTYNAIPYLAYWDIYKNYYANKQEEVGYYIHNSEPVPDINGILQGTRTKGGTIEVIFPASALPYLNIELPLGSDFLLSGLPATATPEMLRFNDTRNTEEGNWTKFFKNYTTSITPNGLRAIQFLGSKFEGEDGTGFYGYIDQNPRIAPNTAEVNLKQFPLENIDKMRDNILMNQGNTTFFVSESSPYPYNDPLIYDYSIEKSYSFFSQEGLAIKTYQSDIFNNWINTEWIDGENGINTITAVDVSGGTLSMDSLNLAKKVYDMLNRIAISGGSYKDWIETVYTHDFNYVAETPIYEGGLSKEVIFSEIVSNSAAEGPEGAEPLGTLAGKGHLSAKHKGGKLVVRVSEPSFIIGIVSLTPRIDYSQGNDWYTELDTMNDIHKPALDGIGFQELMTTQMAAWDQIYDDNMDKPIRFSAGKQPAWINYMTNYNRNHGNFAKKNNEMYMVLNRNYSINPDAANGSAIMDLTTYIQPDKFNYAFADTRLTAMNFWVQVASKIEARRVMSAKIIPNL